jgi:uncharacterized radical SAM protein YgiQ
MSRAEITAWGWDELDVLLVSGDAYVDHPSFGVALLGRWLVTHGFRVGIVAQPRWDSAGDIARMGRPRLFAGVTAGALDSMLAHYTAFRKKRHDDAYTPGGQCGARPNRACLVYAGLVRQAFPGLPVVLGGIEASLRRATHYDFWTDKIRRSILLDSKADAVVYGMGERAVLDIARRLTESPGPDSLRGIRGTVFSVSSKMFDQDPEAWSSSALDSEREILYLPSHEDIAGDARQLMTATLALEGQVHHGYTWAVQAAGDRRVVFTPPAAPLTSEELDGLYALPFTRRPHPAYREPIPAAEMIQFSVTSHRGCGGGCSFCSLALHQGRRIRSRSAASLRAEVALLAGHPDWKGSITDVGGPTANMWGAECAADPAQCQRASCLTPRPCPHFRVRQTELARLLRELRGLPGVQHLRVASGVRHDLAMREEEYLRTLTSEFVGGQLKIAPEHCCENVLRLMRKPGFQAFEQFMTVFERISRGAGKQQFLVPYLISAFPGCTDDDMRRLADWLHERGWRPQQVQCFIPTPGTVATAMYYAGIDPEGVAVPVARSDAERLRQHRILVPENR